MEMTTGVSAVIAHYSQLTRSQVYELRWIRAVPPLFRCNVVTVVSGEWVFSLRNG
jgi:hypothetical protein